MNRQQAVQWCVDNIIEWPEFKPSITPDGWYWTPCFGQWVLDAGETSVPIDEDAWNICKHMNDIVDHLSCDLQIPKFMLIGQPRRINHDNTIPCGQSFSDLMKELNNA